MNNQENIIHLYVACIIFVGSEFECFDLNIMVTLNAEWQGRYSSRDEQFLMWFIKTHMDCQQI